MKTALNPLPMFIIIWLYYLAVLSVVHTGNENRIISFRRASREEREVYHEWLANEFE